jgi:hypothetical protein
VHRLASRRDVLRFRAASLFFFLAGASAIAALTMLARIALEPQNPQAPVLALGLLGLTVVLWITQAVLSAQARCPLCQVPPLARKGCSKNRNAQRMFGSFRVRVATSVLTRGHFKCPYCNEPSAVEARQRHGRSRG